MTQPKSTAIENVSVERRFSPELIQIVKELFAADWEQVLEALTRPVETYFVRCNTHKITSEELKGRLARRGLSIVSCPSIPEALGIPIQGPFDVPMRDRLIVVNKQTAESVLQGANVYAPGILNCSSVRVGDAVTVVSELGEPLGSGRMQMGATEILTFRRGLAVAFDYQRYRGPQIRDLPEHSEGLLYPQSLCAMATARVLDPREGDLVIDMNCAPGGKLSHISQLMKNSGRILGFDRNARKIDRVRKISTRLGCANLVLFVHDARYLDVDFPELKADRVLIDPPCSALGLRPKVYDFTTYRRVESLANYQKQFVKAASKIVKPGGTVVYSVCTFTSQECEAIVDFAERECNLQTVEQNLKLGSEGFRMYGNSGALCQRFHPRLHEMGYFIAKFER